MNFQMVPRSVALSAIAFLSTCLCFFPFASIGVDAHHDGIMLKPALDINDGLVLHKDSFSQYGTVTSLVQGAGLRILGENLLMLRLATVFAYALSSSFLILFWKDVYGPRLAILSHFIWLSLPAFYTERYDFLPWSSVIAMVFQSITIWIMGRIARNASCSNPSSVLLPLMLGTSATLTFLSRQPVGALLIAACLLSLAYLGISTRKTAKIWDVFTIRWFLRSRTVIPYLISVAFSFITFFVWAFWNQLEQDWYHQNIEWPARWARISSEGLSIIEIGKLFSSKDSLLLVFFLLFIVTINEKIAANRSQKQILVIRVASILAMVVLLLLTNPTWKDSHNLIPIASLIAFAYLMFRDKSLPNSSSKTMLIACTPIALASWAQVYPVDCPRHSFWAITPFVGYIFAIPKLSTTLSPTSWIVAVLAILSPCLFDQYSGGIKKLLTAPPPIKDIDILNGMRVKGADIDGIRKLTLALNAQKKNHQILYYGRDALIPCVLNSSVNPDPYYVNWGYYSDTEEDKSNQLRRDFIRNEKPVIVLAYYKHSPKTEEYRVYESLMKELGYLELTSGPIETGREVLRVYTPKVSD